MRDYDSWKSGWYDASYERDPGEEIAFGCKNKSVNDWGRMQDSFIQLVKQLYMADKNEEEIKRHITWLAEEFHVDGKLFNMGLI